MKKIKLTQNKYALVDDKDFSYLNQWRWHYANTGYAMRRDYSNYKKGDRGKIVSMHRMLLGALRGQEVDHINENKLDNRRKNLRLCSRSQNNLNRGPIGTNTSGFKGVSWKRDKMKWRAYIAGKFIGHFDSKVDAARAYDREAVRLFGDFARLNLPHA